MRPFLTFGFPQWMLVAAVLALVLPFARAAVRMDDEMRDDVAAAVYGVSILGLMAVMVVR